MMFYLSQCIHLIYDLISSIFNQYPVFLVDSIGNSIYELELGDVNPGIYLVAIQTVDGIKAKRLIVNE